MKSNTRFDGNKRGVECLNCQQPISNRDNFCSNCGQVNDLQPLSIKQYLTEFLSGFFSFDTRTLNTIVPLLFKPGKVTNEYVYGHRMKYVNPFQLYLHTSIIFFLITGIFSSIDSYKDIANKYESENPIEKQKDSLLNKTKKDLKKVKDDLEFNIDLGLLKFKYSDKNSDTIKNKPKLRNRIIQNSDSLFNHSKFKETVTDSLLTTIEKDKIINNLIKDNVPLFYSEFKKNDFLGDSLKNYQNFKMVYLNNLDDKLLLNEIDYKISDYSKMNTGKQILKRLGHESFFNKLKTFTNCKTKNVGKALDSLGYKRTTTNVFWFKKAKEFRSLLENNDSKDAYLSDFISKIPIVLFFMLPVFALFMKLFYIRRKINYTEHLIFIFHIQTVFFLNLLLSIILDRIFNSDIFFGISFLLFLIYLYIALRKYYKQSKWKTFFKFILLNMTYFFLSIIGSVLVMFLAFLI